MSLRERIESEGYPSELASLAGTLNEMLEQLEESLERTSGFTADIAHDLRTPVDKIRPERNDRMPWNSRHAAHAGPLQCDDKEPASGHLSQVIELGLRMLIDRAHPHIKNGAFHRRRPFGEDFAT